MHLKTHNLTHKFHMKQNENIFNQFLLKSQIIKKKKLILVLEEDLLFIYKRYSLNFFAICDQKPLFNKPYWTGRLNQFNHNPMSFPVQTSVKNRFRGQTGQN